jgi:hypothetical protein
VDEVDIASGSSVMFREWKKNQGKTGDFEPAICMADSELREQPENSVNCMFSECRLSTMTNQNRLDCGSVPP